MTDGDLISRTDLLNKIWQKEYGKDYDGVNMLDIPHIDIIENLPSYNSIKIELNGDLISEIDKLPRIKVGNSNSPTVKYCIDEVLIRDLLENYKSEKTAEKPIKHFGSIECPNCGRLLMLEEPLRIKVENPEIKVDLISREEVLEELNRIKNEKVSRNGGLPKIDRAINYVAKLPTYSANLVKESGVLVKDLVKDGDLISRKAVLKEGTYFSNRPTHTFLKFVKELPTYSAEQTENPTKDIDSAIEYWKSVDEDNNMVKWLTELQEYRKAEREKAEQTYGWCKCCKEYDTKKHCCHRYSGFIRESLQDSINAVLEDIKKKLLEKTRHISHNEILDVYDEGILQAVFVIDKYISGKESVGGRIHRTE